LAKSNGFSIRLLSNDKEISEKLLDKTAEIGRMLNGLRKSIEKRI
jgi:hypothetical protein